MAQISYYFMGIYGSSSEGLGFRKRPPWSAVPMKRSVAPAPRVRETKEAARVLTTGRRSPWHQQTPRRYRCAYSSRSTPYRAHDRGANDSQRQLHSVRSAAKPRLCRYCRSVRGSSLLPLRRTGPLKGLYQANPLGVSRYLVVTIHDARKLKDRSVVKLNYED